MTEEESRKMVFNFLTQAHQIIIYFAYIRAVAYCTPNLSTEDFMAPLNAGGCCNPR